MSIIGGQPKISGSGLYRPNTLGDGRERVHKPIQQSTFNSLNGIINALGNLAARYDTSSSANYSTTTANFTGTGTATSTLITTAFVGVGTAFLGELAPGDTVYNGSAVLIGTILTVTDNTNAVLTSNGAAAITGAAFQIKKANSRVILLGDSSGNSGVNVLALNGVNSNWASVPNAAVLQITGDIDLRAQLSLSNWASGGNSLVIMKDVQGGAVRAYGLFVDATGHITMSWSVTGTGANGSVSTVAVGFANFAMGWIRATLAVASGTSTFYTSTDGVTWTPLGVAVVTGATSIFAGTSPIGIGANSNGNTVVNGNIYRAQIYNGIAGTLVFDANFSLAAKLAASFTESSVNAATVTINTTGDLGARICGARDEVELTAGKQATIGAAGLLFDGVNDYMKCAAFVLNQPETIYVVFQNVSQAANLTIFDGNTDTSFRALQAAVANRVNITAGSTINSTSTFVNGSDCVLSAVFNGTNSSIQHNRDGAVTGAVGAANAGGFTIANVGTTLNAWANIRVREILIFSTAHDSATQALVIGYLGVKWNISV